MASTAAAKKRYIVTSTGGSWHYAPVEAESPEAAVRLSDDDAETSEGINNGTEYYVYEIASLIPTIIKAKAQLVEL